MSEVNEQNNNEVVEAVAEPNAVPAQAPVKPAAASDKGGFKRDFKKNKRPFTRGKSAKPKSEFITKIIDIRRVTRVSSGGRRFNFSVVIIAGDKKGRVGVGIGKAGDTALAVEKATKDARKKAIKVLTTRTMSIPHEVNSKYCSAIVKIMPAKGRGLIAGSALRDAIELAGIQDVNAKILSGSKNKLNIARATIDALKKLKTPVGKEAFKEGEAPKTERKFVSRDAKKDFKKSDKKVFNK